MGRLKVTCFCGTSVEVDRDRASVGSIREASGFHPVSNVRNGLEIQYVCPPCWARVVRALNELEAVFGGDARYIHFGTLFSKRR